MRTLSKISNTSGQSRDFVSMTNSEVRNGESRNIGLSKASADPEVNNEKTSRLKIKPDYPQAPSYLGSTG